VIWAVNMVWCAAGDEPRDKCGVALAGYLSCCMKLASLLISALRQLPSSQRLASGSAAK